jgi:hypothetical protein
MLHVQLNAKETSSKTDRTGYKPVRSLRIELAAVVGTDCFFFGNIVSCAFAHLQTMPSLVCQHAQ